MEKSPPELVEAGRQQKIRVMELELLKYRICIGYIIFNIIISNIPHRPG